MSRYSREVTFLYPMRRCQWTCRKACWKFKSRGGIPLLKTNGIFSVGDYWSYGRFKESTCLRVSIATFLDSYYRYRNVPEEQIEAVINARAHIIGGWF